MTLQITEEDKARLKKKCVEFHERIKSGDTDFFRNLPPFNKLTPEQFQEWVDCFALVDPIASEYFDEAFENWKSMLERLVSDNTSQPR